ncbi:hypothetical protein GCM10009800_29700 [Nocardiopsis rhodophaea]
MGKHGKEQECKMCKGSGETEIWHDGQKEVRPCVGCGGTGKV